MKCIIDVQRKFKEVYCMNNLKQIVEIIDFDHQGRGIGKLNNKTVFVVNALPGEIVEVDIIQEKKNFIEGKVLNYIKISDKRISPLCPYCNMCGGCDIMHISYQEQLEFKQKKIENIVKRYLNSSLLVKNIIPSCDLHYRNKVTFHVKNNHIGYYKEKSNDLIAIETCFLLDDNINKIYKVIKENMNLNNVEMVVIRTSKNISNSMVIIYIKGKVDENSFIELLRSYVDSIIISYNGEFKSIYGNDFILEKLIDMKFIIKANSFFQVNTLQTERLYSKVMEYVGAKKDEVVLDLYCGTGTIGMFISQNAKEVIGIELNPSAVLSANENKKLNNIDNINFFVGDTGKILKQSNYKVDTIIVDPPRAGLSSLTINEIFKIKPKKIVYVSCDPMTLVRDLNALSKDYNILELTPVDMFPNTSHVECVSLLQKKTLH